MFMSAGSSAGLLSLACVVQNESSVNINSLLTRYSFAEAADELKLRGEIALWRQRWIRLKMAFDDVVPETAAAAFEACDHDFPAHSRLPVYTCYSACEQG